MTLPTSASAQIIPDRTLGNENSIIERTSPLRQDIRGGAIRGDALFHSFQEFNVNTGQSVFFDASGLKNIFTRVTGGNISNILGTLGVTGNANLYLINPNGIIFGKDARFALNGSFFASTANTVLFNNFEFSAVNPENVPSNININFPLNFGFRERSGQALGVIQVLGEGNTLEGRPRSMNPIQRSFPQDLQDNFNPNIYLLGNTINFDEGIIRTPGDITLIAVKSGEITLNSNEEINLNRVQDFGDIALLNRSLIDTTSPKSNPTISSGKVEIIGKNLRLENNSIILNQNYGNIESGNINIKATDSLNLSGNINGQQLLTGIYSETLNSGAGAKIFISSPEMYLETATIRTNTFSVASAGDIFVSIKNLTMLNGARIINLTADFGRGGNLNISASNDIQLFDSRESLKEKEGAFIGSSTLNFGKGGDVTVSARNLYIKDGSAVGSGSRAVGITQNLKPGVPFQGEIGDVYVDVADTIAISGKRIVTVSLGNESREIIVFSRITSGTTTNLNTGNVSIKTGKLLLNNEAQISTESALTGRPGLLSVEASEIVSIENNGLIGSFSRRPSQELLDLNLSPVIQENVPSGRLTITTPELKINNGTISVANEFLGDAGELTINANRIRIGNSGSITAFSRSGQGGTVRVNSRDIQVTGTSSITSSSEGITTEADAGSINITSDRITLNNSWISTNAFAGDGGNITVNTKDLRAIDNSQISASVGRDAEGNPVGSGDGGNIMINNLPGTTVLKNNSTINADAVVGDGGRIDIFSSALFADRPVADLVTASSEFGQQGIVNLQLLLPQSQNIINPQIPRIASAVSSLSDTVNTCLTPQRNGLKEISVPKGARSIKSVPFEYFILEPDRETGEFETNQIIEPHFLATRKDGSKFFGAFCFGKNK